jgi:hypothetical protein
MLMTPITDLYDAVRAILGDFNANFRKFEDAAILSVVRTVVITGKLPGYKLNADKTQIDPAIATPRDYALVLYGSALMFTAPREASYSYSTRALKERFGEQKAFLLELHHALYEAQFPSMMSTWSNMSTWLTGITGLNVWTHLTQLDTHAPVAQASIGVSGLVVNSGSQAG